MDSPPSLQYWREAVAGYRDRDAARVAAAGSALLGLLEDMDGLLATNAGFMLGVWVGGLAGGQVAGWPGL